MKNESFAATLKKNSMLIILVLVYLFFLVLTKGGIFQSSSFTELINQNAYVYILGVGMLMCMLTGGNIDLSCGAFVCLLGAIGGMFMIVKGMGTGVSILLLVLIGVLYGVILGFLIAYVNIPPWIATLAGFLAFRGLGTSILSNNSTTGSLAPFPVSFQNVFYGRVFPTNKGVFNIPCFAAGLLAAAVITLVIFLNRKNRIKKGYEADTIRAACLKSVISDAAVLLVMYKLAWDGGIPTTLLWVAGIVLIYSFITSKTTLGRYFYTIGGNKEATRLSGVDTKKIMFFAYLNMAVLTVLTSYVVIARFQAANSTAGTNYEMDAIAACVVGGVSAYGGSGSVFGMVVGATLIGVINLGMQLMNVDADWQKIVKGAVLLGAVVFDIIATRKNSSR